MSKLKFYPLNIVIKKFKESIKKIKQQGTQNYGKCAPFLIIFLLFFVHMTFF